MIVKEYAEGKMSKHIANLKVGDTLEMKGPIPKYNWEENKVENVGMIAGGTGITPMVSLFFAEMMDDGLKLCMDDVLMDIPIFFL